MRRWLQEGPRLRHLPERTRILLRRLASEKIEGPTTIDGQQLAKRVVLANCVFRLPAMIADKKGRMRPLGATRWWKYWNPFQAKLRCSTNAASPSSGPAIPGTCRLTKSSWANARTYGAITFAGQRFSTNLNCEIQDKVYTRDE